MSGRWRYVDWAEAANMDKLHKFYFEDEMSASDIAKAFGIPSRNVICGKVHRLGWKRDGAVARHNRGQSNTRRAAVARGIDPVLVARKRPKPAPRPRLASAQPRRKPIPTVPVQRPDLKAVGGAGHLPARMDLNMPANADPVAYHLRPNTRCAWPIGPAEEPGHSEMVCCGAPAEEGRPYCRNHLRSAWNGRPLKKLRIVEPTVIEVPTARRAA